MILKFLQSNRVELANYLDTMSRFMTISEVRNELGLGEPDGELLGD